MKETINKMTEKQIALLTLALTVVALVIGIALPEIRAALGLEGRGTKIEQSQASVANAEMEDLPETDIPTPPTPPGSKKELPRTELKEDYSNGGAQTGEFIVFPGVTFTNTGYLKGKVIIEKGATFKNTGAIEGEVINKGGKFENTGYLDGPLKTE